MDLDFKGFVIITTLTGEKNPKNLIIPKNNNFFIWKTKQKYGLRDKLNIDF